MSDVSKFAIDNFVRVIGREPSPHECKWVGRWDPPAAVRFAALNPEGEPDVLVSICVPNVWETVSIYAELTISALPRSHGSVTGFRSFRYHDGDDAAWPLRSSAGEIIRNNGGHMTMSLMFRAPHVSVDPVTEATWPKETSNRAMWHLETFMLPFARQYIGKNRRVPKHLVVEAHPLVKLPEKPTVQLELERRVAELENQLTKKR